MIYNQLSVIGFEIFSGKCSGKIMEDIEIYGKTTKDIPDLNTLKALEKNKNYILNPYKEFHKSI